MLLLALLTGSIVVLVYLKQIPWMLLLLLCSWGLLAGSTPLGNKALDGLRELSGNLNGWFV